jgi:hypothetical protein
MVVGDAFSNCDGSSAFPTPVAVNSINIVIWKKKPLSRFEMCLWKQDHIYT